MTPASLVSGACRAAMLCRLCGARGGVALAALRSSDGTVLGSACAHSLIHTSNRVFSFVSPPPAPHLLTISLARPVGFGRPAVPPPSPPASLPLPRAGAPAEQSPSHQHSPTSPISLKTIPPPPLPPPSPPPAFRLGPLIATTFDVALSLGTAVVIALVGAEQHCGTMVSPSPQPTFFMDSPASHGRTDELMRALGLRPLARGARLVSAVVEGRSADDAAALCASLAALQREAVRDTRVSVFQ